MNTACARTTIARALARALAPRPPLRVSEWAARHRVLSSKGSAIPGPWDNTRNPLLVEVMDCFSARSPVHEVVAMFPVQFGKALALDTPIPTPDGWMAMGDIQPGQRVLGHNGHPVKVIAVSEVFTGHDCYRVEFSDGESIIADTGHRWQVIDTLTRNEARRSRHARRIRPQVQYDGRNAAHTCVLTTEELHASFRLYGKQSRYAIPLPAALRLRKRPLPVDPYTLGVWLGDGYTASGQLSLNGDDASHILARIAAAGHQATVRPYPDRNCVNVMLDRKGQAAPTFCGRLTRAGLLGHKHIPAAYLRASVPQRLALLQGLLDTDGYANPRGVVEIYSVHPALAEGIIELARTLGFKPTVRIKQTSGRPAHRITFTAYRPSRAFSLPRKLAALPPPGPRAADIAGVRFITNIVPVPSVPTRCISADSPDHLFLCGRGFIPTHNSESETNILAYTMCENPQPVMVVLPSEVSLNKWVDQKLNPLIESTPAVARVLTSINSRDTSNRRAFKDFEGGQLYIEHAGNPVRLKSTSVGLMLVDEFSSFANELKSGDDPDALLDGRTSAFPGTWKRLKIGTPETEGLCRISALYAQSDQRRWHWRCPECGHEQPFEWHGLKFSDDGEHVWYACRSCEAVIEEHQKTALIAGGRWVPANPSAKIRGYHANCLYYPLGLGPRWRELRQMWLAAQGDPARLKTFVNDRLAEPWLDPSFRKANAREIAERLEPYRLRHAPLGVLAATAGVDTQDDRLAVHITGWGRGMVAWVLDYIEIQGDPGEEAVWAELTGLLNRPIEHASGGVLVVEATAIDAGGHRTEHVKHFVRQRRIRRPLCIFGARPNNAPILSRGKLQDVNYKGKLDKKGVHIYHVGTVAAKHWLYQRLAADAGKAPEDRLVHLSEGLDQFYLDGLVSETFNPRLGRFEKRRGGVRNEPLDCFDRETEVLTRSGWKQWPEVSMQDELATVHLPTDQIEYQRPQHLIDRPYDGEMVQLKGARLDILVTPDHRMVTLKKRHEPQPDGTRRWNFDVPPDITLAKDLTVHHAIKLNATWSGEDRRTIHVPASINCHGREIEPARDVDAVDLAAFFGWWVSEGCVYRGRSRTQGNVRHRVYVSQIKPASRQRLAEVLARLPWTFHATDRSFVATSKQLHDLVLTAGRRQPQRRVPQWIKDARPEVIEAFVKTAIDGDGWIQRKETHHRASRVYATTSPRLADDMQELFIKLGRAATMRIVQPDGWRINGRSGPHCLTQYHVYERLASRAYLDGGGNGQRGFFGQRVPYQGRVYCASVPNGTLILRRGGKTFIAGNCMVYSYAAAHHHALRLHRSSTADWDARAARLEDLARERRAPETATTPVPAAPTPLPARPHPRRRIRSSGLY